MTPALLGGYVMHRSWWCVGMIDVGGGTPPLATLSGFELFECGSPVFQVMDFADFPVEQFVDVDGIDAKGSGAIALQPHKIADWSSACDRPDHDFGTFGHHILRLPFEVGDQFPEKPELLCERWFVLGLLAVDRFEIVREDVLDNIRRPCMVIDGECQAIELFDGTWNVAVHIYWLR